MSELKSQIDYSKLEWFDCESNFPPMSIDLYVDSEHGYGIGRLGRLVKDKSIIWTVHLDSGEVYLVYAFYKVKRWAYMPKDEKTNTKLKYELMLNKERSWVPCYLKSEADKVIEEKDKTISDAVQIIKEQEHEIAENDEKIDELQKATDSAWSKVNAMYDELRHQKYKRCLAMAKWCERKRIDAANYRIPRQKWDFYDKWHKRWLELAEKFKPNSTAQ